MLPEKFIIVGIIANALGSLWYFREIIAGHIKPNLVSWFIWMLGPFIGVFFQLKAGAGASVFGTLMAGLTSLTVVIISLIIKNAYWKLEKFDLMCGFISLISLVSYVFTHNLGLSILFPIIADTLAYFPTIKKTWKFPETENSLTYIGGIINNVFALLIITNWIFPIYSFCISLLVMNSVVVFCIYRKKILFWYNKRYV